jgi:hypothetical protein
MLSTPSLAVKTLLLYYHKRVPELARIFASGKRKDRLPEEKRSCCAHHKVGSFRYPDTDSVVFTLATGYSD